MKFKDKPVLYCGPLRSCTGRSPPEGLLLLRARAGKGHGRWVLCTERCAAAVWHLGFPTRQVAKLFRINSTTRPFSFRLDLLKPQNSLSASFSPPTPPPSHPAVTETLRRRCPTASAVATALATFATASPERRVILTRCLKFMF